MLALLVYVAGGGSTGHLRHRGGAPGSMPAGMVISGATSGESDDFVEDISKLKMKRGELPPTVLVVQSGSRRPELLCPSQIR